MIANLAVETVYRVPEIPAAFFSQGYNDFINIVGILMTQDRDMLMAHFVLHYERKGYTRRGGYFEIITVAGLSTSSFRARR